jgi:hypothetical protein
MNWMKKGPEMKLSEIKVPDFLFDLYYDLKERHLLPLVALLVVAIVVAPIALGRSSGSDSSDAGGGAIAIPNAAASGSSSGELVVSRSAPGLRDYRRRLRDARALNPFKQQYAGEPAEAGASSGTSASEVSSSTSPSSSGVEESVSGGAPPGESTPPTHIESGSGSLTISHHLKYYSFAVDVRIVPVSSGAAASKAKPSVRHNLPELTMLPSRKQPALTFIGVTKGAKKAVMLVSSKVRSIFGDASCVVGSEACQLLDLEPGVPETIVYGGEEHTFRIELLKLRLLTSDHLNKAALGSPGKKIKKKR